MKKDLIYYFSRADENYGVGVINTGNTEIIASYLKEILNADTFKVEPSIPYSKEYNQCIKEAEDRQRSGNASIIKNIESIDSYDTIYIGTPVYWSKMPEELVTGLKKFSWDGKKIKLFVTHEGSGLADIQNQIKEICKGAVVVDSISILGRDATESKEKIRNWVGK